ncbi:MAG: phosphoglycerate kinase, partial [Bacteroidota bacterium]|nr:phosphoglycerate kinase [Bacteroidota bacterium]
HFPDNSYFGLLMDNEISNIEKVLNSYEKPFTAIIGGSKVSDKVGIILNLMDKADNILIGGAMAYTFLKAQGEQVGKSRVEEEKLDLAREILQKGIDKGIRILLPADSVCTKEFEENADVEIHESVNIPADMMGLDIGEKAIADYKQIIAESKTILWNGPMGVFEWDKFANGTKSIAFAVADASKTNGAYSLIGGGDSVAAINKFNLDEQVSYVSTGGGAMLEFLEGKELPGIAAIRGK